MTLPGWTRTLALWHQAANTQALLALPTITLGPYMSDDDVEFHSAMLELHTMLEELHDLCIESGEKLRGWINLTDAHRFGLDHPWPAPSLRPVCRARATRILLNRLRPNSTGYRLVSDPTK